MQKVFNFKLLILLVVFLSCDIFDNAEESDTEPPVVSIISHEDGNTVSEITTIIVEATDNDRIYQVWFAVNDSIHFKDVEEPWEYEWNTTGYQDSDSIPIRVVAYDFSDNQTISNIVTVIIDNSTAHPNAVDVLSVDYDLETMTVTWEQSQDADFSLYKLISADTNNVDIASTLHTTGIIADTIYSIDEFNPTVENWFWVETIDQINLSSVGEGKTNEIDEAPEAVPIITVFYNSDALIIEWEQSQELDFASYSLQHRDEEISDWNQIYYSTNIIDSTYQSEVNEFPSEDVHYFQMEVSDVWGLSTTSAEANNEDPDGPPLDVDVLSVNYTADSLTVTWEMSYDGEFVQYLLYYSDSEFGERTIIDSITDNTITAWSTDSFNPLQENWYWVGVEDTYGAISDQGTGMSNEIDTAPNSVDMISVDYVTELGNMYITWEQSDAEDFAYYTLKHSDSEFGEIDSIDGITDIDATTYTLPVLDYTPTIENWFWVDVTDIWNQNAGLGSGMSNALDSLPQAVNVTNVTYNLERLYIFWNQSHDSDFESYQLMRADTENGEYSDVVGYIVANIEDTSIFLSDFDPTIENWFKVETSDVFGQTSVGNGKSNEIDPPPEFSTLEPITFDDENSVYQISWTANTEDDFQEYILYESQNEDFSDSSPILSEDDPAATYFEHYVPDDEFGFHYYQVVVRDHWDQETFSNIEVGSSHLKFIKTHGGSNYDFSFSVLPTTDGYILAGTSTSFSGTADIWIIKTDFEGNEIWNLVIGDGGEERTGESDKSLAVTNDGGFILTGITGENGSRDAILIKLTANGSVEWEESYGDNEDDRGLAVMQSSDGGYVFTGEKTTENIHYIWLVKTDNSGTVEWEKEFGGGVFDSGHSVEESSDGGFVVTGKMDIPGNSTDLWIGKTDTQGNITWADTLGGISFDEGYTIQETSDGGYIVAGTTRSMGAGGYDAYIIKTDVGGAIIWNYTYGGSYDDQAFSIEESADGNSYTFCGRTNSYGNGMFDSWIVQIDSNGNELYNFAVGGGFTEYSYCIRLANDGGYIVTGETSSIGTGGSDILLIKTDSHGNTAPFEE